MTKPLILIPTDFSDAARNATDYAIALAKDLDHAVLLFHVYNTPAIDSPGMMGTLPIDISHIEEGVKKQLKEEAEYLQRQHNNISIEYAVANGFISDEIIVAENQYKPSLIIMGMKPSGTLKEKLLGSTATDILLQVHTPLFVIPEKAKYNKIEKVAIGNDPKLQANAEISPVIKNMFEKFHSTIHIITVLKEHHPDETDKASAEGKMEKHFENNFHSYYFPENEDIVNAINDFVDLNKIDLVVMMPYRHSFFERIFGTSQTRRLAFHSHVPMLSLANTRS